MQDLFIILDQAVFRKLDLLRFPSTQMKLTRTTEAGEIAVIIIRRVLKILISTTFVERFPFFSTHFLSRICYFEGIVLGKLGKFD